jgi:hypothetical protein
MKHKTFLAVFLFLFLTGCIKFRNPNEENAPEEVNIQNLEEATIRGEMFLYTGRLMPKEEFLAALEENKKAIEPVKEDVDVILRFRKLRLEKDAALYTMGKNVVLNITLLEADSGSRIATFPEGLTAEMNVVGRSGGDLKVYVEKAEGVLNFEVRGEAGGKGRTGPDPDDRLRGSNGNNSPAIQVPVPKSGGWRCAQETNLERGGKGKQGYPGDNGRDGGNSGKLYVQIIDDSTFDFTVKRVAGAPGARGAGGRGGEGGHGGYPEICNSRRTDTRHQGPKGYTGDDGYPGNLGQAGKEEPYCIESPKKNFCVG